MKLLNTTCPTGTYGAAIMATNDDAGDAFWILTARMLDSEVRFVAAATNCENVGKRSRADAETVISPAAIVDSLLRR